MLAVVFVRDGVLPSGGDEAIAECGGRVLLCGSGTAAARTAVAEQFPRAAVATVETGLFAPAALAKQIAHLVSDDVIVLPGSPDGRDLAPRLAFELRRTLLAGAVQITAHQVWLARGGGREIHEVAVDGPFVATLVPGVRGVDHPGDNPEPVDGGPPAAATGVLDADVTEVLGPDVATMDLTEAPRILAGGAGLESSARFEQLGRIGSALDASVGATRVITDRGWLPHSRQIGTTGAVVDPELYLAFGISGAVQHTAGLGQPKHIVSVNTDPHCPMMQLADVSIVCDANAVLDELEKRVVL